MLRSGMLSPVILAITMLLATFVKAEASPRVEILLTCDVESGYGQDYIVALRLLNEGDDPEPILLPEKVEAIIGREGDEQIIRLSRDSATPGRIDIAGHG